MSKQNIISGANEYASYIINNIPQKTEDAKITYYFSGSLAMLLLPSAKHLSFVGADSSGEIKFISPQVDIPESARTSFKKGVRPLSVDVDVVEIKENTFANKAKVYNIGAVKENCKLATALCPAWSKFGGTMYLDPLSDERNIKSHNLSSIELSTGEHIFIANPIDMMLHKLAETFAVQNKPKQVDKYEKDLKDFSSLFNGVAKTNILPEDMEEYLSTIVQNNEHSCVSYFATVNLEKSITKLLVDAKNYIEPENVNKLYGFLLKLKSFNKQNTSSSQPQ